MIVGQMVALQLTFREMLDACQSPIQEERLMYRVAESGIIPEDQETNMSYRLSICRSSDLTKLLRLSELAAKLYFKRDTSEEDVLWDDLRKLLELPRNEEEETVSPD